MADFDFEHQVRVLRELQGRLAGLQMPHPDLVRVRDVVFVLRRARRLVAEGWGRDAGPALGRPWGVVRAIESAALTQQLPYASQGALFALTAAAGRGGGFATAMEQLLETEQEVLAWFDRAIATYAAAGDDLWDEGRQEYGEAREIALGVIEQRAQIRAALEFTLARVRTGWRPGSGDGYQALIDANAGVEALGPTAVARSWTLGAAIAAGCLDVIPNDALGCGRLHFALVTELVAPLTEYGGDEPAPQTRGDAIAWVEHELAAASARWRLPPATRCQAVRSALLNLAEEWAARSASFPELLEAACDRSLDVCYALAIAAGSGGRAHYPGGALVYSLNGDPQSDAANYLASLPDPAAPHVWDWLGRALGLCYSAWPNAHADFPPFSPTVFEAPATGSA